MSFTIGYTTQVQCGSAIDALDDKIGSFIIFVWHDKIDGPSSTFAVSKNNQGIDWKRLSCVKDSHGLFLVPEVDGTTFSLNLNQKDSTEYSTFNVKILG